MLSQKVFIILSPFSLHLLCCAEPFSHQSELNTPEWQSENEIIDIFANSWKENTSPKILQRQREFCHGGNSLLLLPLCFTSVGDRMVRKMNRAEQVDECILHSPARETSDWAGGWPADKQMTFSTQPRPCRSVSQTTLNDVSRRADITRTSQERLENGRPLTGHNCVREAAQRRMSSYPRGPEVFFTTVERSEYVSISSSFFGIKIANICKTFYSLSFGGTEEFDLFCHRTAT